MPFVLVTLDLGGAWLAYLHALYPYRWLLIGLLIGLLTLSVIAPYLLGALLN